MNVVVTGASGALGLSVVEGLRRRDDTFVLIDRTRSSEFKGDNFVGADLTDPEDTRRAFIESGKLLGRIDAVVHLAGAFKYVPFAESVLKDWRDLFAANVETAVNTIRAALPGLVDGGSITCVGAASAQPAKSGMAPYAAAKSGLSRLVEALSDELKPRRIRVNAVAPAIIDTPRNRADMPNANPADWTSPAAIADVVFVLMGPEGRAINGVTLPVTNPG